MRMRAAYAGADAPVPPGAPASGPKRAAPPSCDASESPVATPVAPAAAAPGSVAPAPERASLGGSPSRFTGSAVVVAVSRATSAVDAGFAATRGSALGSLGSPDGARAGAADFGDGTIGFGSSPPDGCSADAESAGA